MIASRSPALPRSGSGVVRPEPDAKLEVALPPGPVQEESLPAAVMAASLRLTVEVVKPRPECGNVTDCRSVP
jgi:hypothetical protein